MENYKLVMPEHLNHYGFLFGGQLLKWVDEYGYIAAAVEYPNSDFVTIGMDNVEFKKSVIKGTILVFVVEKIKVGSTSVQFSVCVYRSKAKTQEDMIFATNITFVRIDEYGEKVPLPV